MTRLKEVASFEYEPQVDERVGGNKDSILMLKHCLDEAKQGKVDYVMVLMHSEEFRITGGNAGNHAYEPQMIGALKMAFGRLTDSVAGRTPPAKDMSLGADFVCYNPVTSYGYDFVLWLLNMEVKRRKAYAPAPLKVAFWSKEGLDNPQRRMMFDNVMRASIPLLGAVEDDRAVRGGFDPDLGAKTLVDWSKAGNEVPRLRASDLHKAQVISDGLKGAVTITLREGFLWKYRNSNLKAWIKFAQYLQDKGEKVVFIRDTSKADTPLKDFKIYPLASRDLGIRVATYEVAKANMFVSNGPSMAAIMGDVPWLMFIDLDTGHEEQKLYKPGNKEYWTEKMGISQGGQFPWCKPNQRIFWGADTFDNMVKGWNEISAPMSAPGPVQGGVVG